ncbi:hypothetical protein E2C01_094399 [Portunus trituberculatus]|uniref:Uncharacterized protein n=1 Tax=Portunus trituberculatus TaxID=210409 RepID=A0A5B7K0L6_PORTR|nr:hypothetical protein [Portunus trituberculatus]
MKPVMIPERLGDVGIKRQPLNIICESAAHALHHAHQASHERSRMVKLIQYRLRLSSRWDRSLIEVEVNVT